MDRYVAFLEKLKETRKKRGISQEELAKKLGINKIAYNRIENGKTKLSFERLYELIDILGVDFIYELENKLPNNIEKEAIKSLENKSKELEQQLSEKRLLIKLLNEKIELLEQKKIEK